MRTRSRARRPGQEPGRGAQVSTTAPTSIAPDRATFTGPAALCTTGDPLLLNDVEAARLSPGWEDQALDQVRTFARSHKHFATEDVRAVYGTPAGVNPKAWGPVLKRARYAGIVVAAGFTLVNCSNRSPRVRWRSLVFEGGVQA